MPVACISRPQPELLQPQAIHTSTAATGALKIAPRIKKSHRVHFKFSATIRHIRHLNDTCKDEIRNVWYSKLDFDRMKSEITATTKMIAAGVVLKSDNEDQYCTRGVEHRTGKVAKRRRANKMHVLWAVLDEQDRQRLCDTFSDEHIRQACIDRNRICRLAALEMGVADQYVARALDAEDDDSGSFGDDCSLADEEMEYCNFRSDLRGPQFRYLFHSIMEHDLME